ncbi:hypothetical protein Tco_0816814 [Tanacetum coccineum]
MNGSNEEVGDIVGVACESVPGIANQPPTPTNQPTKHQRYHPSNVTNQPPTPHTMNGGNEEAGGIEKCV